MNASMNNGAEESIGFYLRPSENEIQTQDVLRYAKALTDAGVSSTAIANCLQLRPPSYAYDELASLEVEHFSE